MIQNMTMLTKLFCVLTANFLEDFDLSEAKREQGCARPRPARIFNARYLTRMLTRL